MSSTLLGARRHSGLQKEVLKLYGAFMREIREKRKSKSFSSDDNIISLEKYIRQQFKLRSNSVSIREISRIEYFLNLGKRQLRTLKSSQIEGFSFVSVDFPGKEHGQESHNH